MRKQFLHLYFGIAAVLSLAGVAFYLSERSSYEKDIEQRIERSMSYPVSMIREKLKDAPESREERIKAVKDNVFSRYLKRGPHRGRSGSSERGGGSSERDSRSPDRDDRNSGRTQPPTITVDLVDISSISLPSEKKKRFDENETVTFQKDGVQTVYAKVSDTEAIVIGPFTRRNRSRDDEPSMFLLLMLPMAVLLIIGVAVYLLIRPIERRIFALADVTKSFGEGAFSRRVKVGATGAIDELEESFNLMASRIEQLVDGQKELLHAVSHDIRTPLARVFFSLENAQNASTVDEKNSHLKRIDRSLLDLNSIVDELMTYLRLDESMMKPQKDEVDIGVLMNEMCELTSELRDDIDIALDDCNHIIFGHLQYVKRAVENLLTNAVRHSRGKIIIRCSKINSSIKLSVEDDGQGVTEDQREKIFQPFYRLDSSRSSELGGSGLGLAIVARIMAWHDGSVDVTDSDLGGACFTLTFPDRSEI